MRICSVDGCERKHYGRGLCKPCYLRAWSKGVHTEHPREQIDPSASLADRLRHHGWTVTRTGCWEWNGYRDHNGYGRLQVGRGRGNAPEMAHRAAFRAWVGDLEPEMVVCHACDNPPCINPAHLSAGSRSDNNRDAMRKRRTANGERKPHKLTDAQVREIRLRYMAGGVTQLELAKEYGVGQQMVGMIAAGKRRVNPTNPALESLR